MAILLRRGVAIRCSLHGLGIVPNIKESVVKGVLLSSPSPRFRMFRANESHANKAGVVLDRMGHQRTHVDDEVLWNTSSAQKDLRNMACRAVDGINANRRWIAMLHCLKPFHSTQINVIELCPSYFRAADLSILRSAPLRLVPHKLASLRSAALR